jgi:hypothetical protein
MFTSSRPLIIALLLSVGPLHVGCDDGKQGDGKQKADDEDDKKKSGDDDDDDDDSDDKKSKKKSKKKADKGDDKGDDDDDDDAGGVGISNPGNAEPVVALAKTVIACEYDAKFGFKKCDAENEFYKADAVKNGAADATLVNFLADEDLKVRYLGASGLYRAGRPYREDKALAKLVIEAAEKEQDELVGRRLGSAAGYIKADATGTKDALAKIAKSHPNAALREQFVGTVQQNNRDTFYDLTKDLALNDKDEKVRVAALSAFWAGSPTDKQADVCGLWAGLATHDASEAVAAKSAHYIGFSSRGQCADQYDAVLDSIDKRAKAGEVKDINFAYAVKYIHNQESLKPPQKAKAVRVAQAILDNKKNGGTPRASALEFLVKDAKRGPNFAKKYEKDEEFFVKSRAKTLQEQK